MTISPPRVTTAPTRQALRKTLAATAIAATLIGTVPASALAPAEAATAKTCDTPDFTDVRKGAAFYTAVTWLRCEGISVGYANGSYGASRRITRGETAQLLYRFSGETHTAGTRQDFTDVKSGDAGFAAISWMKAKGYTTGYANGSFGPRQAITRGELSAFLYRMADQSGYRAPSTPPFPDVKTTDTFYAASAWLHDTGLVTGYTDSTFRTGRDVTRGETAQFLYALETRLNGAPSSYQVPARPASLDANPTGGSGGAYRDATALPYSNGVSTSTYHLYASHLDGKAPHGIIVYLHGDGGFDYDQPQWSVVPQYHELARKHGLMLVVPRTPDRAGSHTWWEGDASHQYAADLFRHLGKNYNLDLNQVYWTGHSGGADTIAEHMVDKHSAAWTGGAAVIVAGGGIYQQLSRPISAALRENFQMHWVVGSRDNPADGGSSGSYDAVKAAKLGHSRYTQWGLQTSLTVVPGLDHWQIEPQGPATLATILDRR